MPSRIGRYDVRLRIGSGGFATVWLAHDAQLDSPVAIKVLAENWTEDHHVRRRFLEEGRFLRRVTSPHVVTVHDAGELPDGRPYLVMSYADRGTLADRLEADPVPVGQAVEVVRQLGSGLTALHQRGVLHRDVKPANVLFTSEDGGPLPVRVMLADLGLGKALDVSSRLTMIAGTPSYVAPEQAAGEPLDERADLYSLGALAHLLLAGRPAFSHASLAAAREPGPPPPLSAGGRDFGADVEAVVARALEVDRERRWPDVASFVAALQEAVGSAEVRPEAAATPLDVEQRTHPAPRRGRDDTTDPEEPDPSGPVPTVPVPRGRATAARLAVAGVVALAVGVTAGALVPRVVGGSETLTDSTGALSVTVPAAWARHVATGEWDPPGRAGRRPSLSVGSESAWNRSGEGEGVFLGILAGEGMPERLPGHDGCGSASDPVVDVVDGDPQLTRVSTDCPGVVVERVRQVADGQYLWVQVRSDERAEAYDVLEQVRARGF